MAITGKSDTDWGDEKLEFVAKIGVASEITHMQANISQRERLDIPILRRDCVAPALETNSLSGLCPVADFGLKGCASAMRSSKIATENKNLSDVEWECLGHAMFLNARLGGSTCGRTSGCSSQSSISRCAQGWIL